MSYFYNPFPFEVMEIVLRYIVHCYFDTPRPMFLIFTHAPRIGRRSAGASSDQLAQRQRVRSLEERANQLVAVDIRRRSASDGPRSSIELLM
jgi:hypothetical protein